MNTKLRQFFKRIISVRVLIFAAIIISTMIPMLVVGIITVSGYRNQVAKNLMIEIMEQGNLLAADIATSSYLLDQNSDYVNAEVEQLTQIYSLRILILNSDFKIIRDNYLFEEGKTLVCPKAINAFNGNVSTEYFVKQNYAEIFMPIYSVDNSKVVGVINITVTDMNMDDNVEYYRTFFTTVVLVVFILALVFAYAFSELIIRPLNSLNKSIRDISNGKTEDRVEGRSMYEYNRISDSVNVMLDRIKVLDQSRQEFVSNVSHELKTPMTSMKVLADSLLNEENVPAEMYREFMEDIVAEIDRENHIISSLLTMVKYDKSKADMEVSTVNINELIELILKRLRPIAVTKNVELVLESYRPVVAEIDEVKLTLALTNLVENAIKYNIENGWVRVSINADHKYFYVKISDSGIGIPTDNVEQIFDRFYRVDKARARETGGTGLGLSIVKQLVELMDGNIRVESEAGKGSMFSFHIWVEIPQEEMSRQAENAEPYVTPNMVESLSELDANQNIWQYGTAENLEEIRKKMPKLILSVEMENWEKAEMFAETIKQLTAEAPAEVKSAALRLKMAVQKGVYEKVTAAFEKLQALIE